MPSFVDHPLSVLLSRLPVRDEFEEEDRATFLALRPRIEIHAAGTALVCQGDPVKDCIFLIDGFVSRTKIMGNDHKQILAFCIPGDAVDLQTMFLDYADHTLETHAPTTIAIVPQSEIARIMRTRPNIMRALWIEALIEAAIFREWALNIGGRSARQRIAHLMLELETRFQAHTRSNERAFPLPVKQAGLASALGLSLVHLNKSLKWLRQEGFLNLRGRTVEVSRREELIAFCDFDPAYLHLLPARAAEDQLGTKCFQA